MSVLQAVDWRRYAVSADIEGFEDDATATSTKWSRSGSSTLSAGTGRFGQNSVVCQSGSAQLLKIMLPSGLFTGTTLIVSMDVKFESNATSAVNFGVPIFEVSGATGSHLKIYLDSGGTIQIMGAAGTFLGRAQHVFETGVWHTMEIKVNLADAGSLSMNLDGIAIFTSLSGDFKQDAGALTLLNVWLAGRQNTYYGDMVIMDTAGTVNNDFLTDFRFELQIPDADGATLNWTASAGTRFQTIDDAIGFSSGASGAGYDTDYISDNTLNDINMSSHGAVTASGYTAIQFTALVVVSRADTAGDKVAMLATSSASTTTGPDLGLKVSGAPIAADYRWRRAYFDKDPNGSIAWTPTSINAAEFGVKKR